MKNPDTQGAATVAAVSMSRTSGGIYNGYYGKHPVRIERDGTLNSWFFAIDGEETTQGQATLHQAKATLELNLHLLHSAPYACTCLPLVQA